MPLNSLSALKIGEGNVRVLTLSSLEELSKLHELYKKGEDIRILGEGTNSVFGSFSGLIVKLNLLGLTWTDPYTLTIAGGEQWQTAVDATIALNLTGIERLTGIPGTVGAAPIQNIGAFGQLLSVVLSTVTVYDYALNATLTIPALECGFGAHRQSNFKTKLSWSTYCIISITLNLASSDAFQKPDYDALVEYASSHDLALSSSKSVEHVVWKYRLETYPDYRIIPNTGSYFTNFESSIEEVEALPQSIMNIKHKMIESGRIRFQCKDLLDSIGVHKGHIFSGGLQMRDSHNNFLINPDSTATVKDLLDCHDYVNSRLKEKYGITLTPEAEFIDDSTAR